MSAQDDLLALLGQPSIQDDTNNVITIYENGQAYDIDTTGFATQEEAVDAFFAGQNEPVSIEPSEETVTDIQIPPQEEEEVAFDFDAPIRAQSDFEEEKEVEDLPFDLDVARRDFSRSVFDTFGQGLKGAAVTDASSKRRAAGDFEKVLGGEFSDPKGQSVDFLGYLMSGGDASKEETDAILAESLKRAPDVGDIMDSAPFRAGTAIEDWAEEFFPTEAAYNNTLQRKLAEGAGSLVAFAASSIGTPVLTAAFGGSVNASTQFSDAIMNGASLDDALKSADLGFGVGTTEALPIGNAVRRLDKGTGGLFSDTITKSLRKKFGNLGKITGNGVAGALEEAIQEGFVEVLNNVSAKDIIGYDEKRDRFQGAGESAQIGGTLGFVLNTITSALGIGKRNLQAGAKKRIRSELNERRAAEREAIEQQREQDLKEQDVLPLPEGEGSIKDTLPPVQPISAGTAVNDPTTDFVFTEARAQILEELKNNQALDALSDSDIDRLANLRADSRRGTTADQLNLDLEVAPQQEQLDLQQQEFFADPPAQIPGQQQQLPLENLMPTQGPSAPVESIAERNTKAVPVAKALGKSLISTQSSGPLNEMLGDGQDKLVLTPTNAGSMLEAVDRHIDILEGQRAEWKASDASPQMLGAFTRKINQSLLFRHQVQKYVNERPNTPERTGEVAEIVDLEARRDRSAAPQNLEQINRDVILQDAAVRLGYEDKMTPTEEGVTVLDMLGRLPEADKLRIQEEALRYMDKVEVDEFEKLGIDVSSRPGIMSNLLETSREADTTQAPVLESVPANQQELRLPDPFASEPVTPALDQPELGLEGGGDGAVVPPPPRKTGGSGGGRIPPNVQATGTAMPKGSPLEQVARSRNIAGEPTTVEINDDGSAASIDGRTPINKERDGWISKAGDFVKNFDVKGIRLIPESWKLWLDIGMTTSMFKGRTDVKIMKDIMRAVGADGRAHAKRVEHDIRKIENLYKAKTGKKLEDASREELGTYTEFMHGQITRDTVKERTKASDEFLDTLDSARLSIGEMSALMIQYDMIPSELRLTFQNNVGSYISVSYAANVLNQDLTARGLQQKIPEEVRNQWFEAFAAAYIDPINTTNQGMPLEDRSMGELRRMVRALGLVERRRVLDQAKQEEEPGAERDILVLSGDTQFKPYEQATKEMLLDALANFGGMNKDEMTGIMLKALSSTQGSLSGGKGKDHSIERRLTLARPAAELAAEGYNQQEIEYHAAMRNLLQETVNPSTNIGITMNKMMSTILAHRLINDIASLHNMGLVSLKRPNPELGHTEALIPRGGAMGDIRIPDPDVPGEYISAGQQEDAAGKNDGIYVTPRMARMFQHMTKAGKDEGAVFNTLRWMAGMTKINLTAYSPRSHPRNIGTAAMLSALRGHSITNFKQVMDSFSGIVRLAARDLGNNKLSENEQRAARQDAMDVILEYMTSLGIFNDSVRTGPVRELMTKVLESRDAALLGQDTYVDENYQSIEGVLRGLSEKGRTKVGRKLAQYGEKPMALFRLEDEAVKAFAFMIERRRYAKLIGRQDLVDMIDGKTPMNEQQLAEMRQFDKGIAAYITDLYPTYSRVPVGIRAASRNLVATPFPSFTAEMWRNGINDLKDMQQLYTGTGRYEGVPEQQRMSLFTTRLMVKMGYHTAVSGLVSSATMLGLASTAVGLDPTDDEFDEAFEESMKKLNKKNHILNSKAIDMAVRTIAPTYMRDSLFSIVGFNPGEDMTIRNLTFTLPNSQQLEYGYALANAMEMIIAGGDWDRAGDRMLSATTKLVSDYVKADVLAATVLEANEGKTATGMPIWDQTDSEWEKRVKQSNHILKMLVPGSRVIREGDKFMEAIKDERFLAEMKEFITGTNDTTFRIDTLWSGTMRVLQDEPNGIKNTNTEINRLIRNNKEMSDNEFLTEYLKLEEQRYDAFKDVRRTVRGGEALGMTAKQMQQEIATTTGLNNPGGMTVKDILRDKYEAHTPDKDALIAAYRPPRSGSMSPEQEKDARRDFRSTIIDRIRLVKDYRRAIEAGDFSL